MEEVAERTKYYGSMVRYSIKGRREKKTINIHTHTKKTRKRKKKTGKQKKNLQRSRGGRRATLHVEHTTFGENEFLSCRSSCIPCWGYIAGDIKVLADIVCINYNR